MNNTLKNDTYTAFGAFIRTSTTAEAVGLNLGLAEVARREHKDIYANNARFL